MIKQLAIYSVILSSWALTLHAENTQTSLARKIEEISVTATRGFFDPLIYRREMSVDGCNIVARTVKVDAEKLSEEVTHEIRFDLAHTQVPNPFAPLSDEFAFVGGEDYQEKGTALFELHFTSPYMPISRSNTSGKLVEQPVKFTRFLMDPVTSEEQPRQLLALLSQYKADYCIFSG